METTLRLTESTNPGVMAVTIRGTNKADAQAAIKVVRAWLSLNGKGSKLVAFTVEAGTYSKLVRYYSARVCFKA